MKNARSFAGSFNPVSYHENCSLKNHYRGAMREVVGYLDKLANLNPERFVFPSVDDIVEHCKKYQTKNLHGKRWVEKVLAELRHRRILSGRVQRVVFRVERDGWIMAPHDCVTRRVEDACIFVGPMHGCGRWQRTGDGGPGSVLYWNGCRDHAQANACEFASPACDEKPVEKPVCRPVDRPGERPVCRPVTTQLFASDNAEVSSQNGHGALVTVIPVSTEGTEKAEITTSKPGLLTTSRTFGAGAPTGHNNDKPLGSGITIGAQFGNQKNDFTLLAQITDGIFEPWSYKGELDVLMKHVRAVVIERAAQPWDKQRSTLAQIVDQATKRAAAEGDRNKGWFKSLKELQQGGPCKNDYQPPPLTGPEQLAANRARGFVGKALTSFNDFANQVTELCADCVYRTADARQETGYTIQAADGVWDKA